MIAVPFLLAAAIGAVARAVIGRRLNAAFPTGTVLINVSGALALGLLNGAGAHATTVIGTGGLGAYTTFSSFGRDAVALIEQRRWWSATAYVGATLVIGVGAAALGLAVSRGSW